jgi:hypothetical protein
MTHRGERPLDPAEIRARFLRAVLSLEPEQTGWAAGGSDSRSQSRPNANRPDAAPGDPGTGGDGPGQNPSG